MSSTVPPTVPPSTGSPSTNGSSPPPIYSTRFKIIAAVLVTLVIVGFVAAYLSTADSDDNDSTGDSFVERLIPGRDSQLVQQGTVGIDLAAGWEARLVIDGVAIPDDELNVVDSLNLTEFTAGPDKVMEALPIGTICATATVWQASTGPEESRQITWCFEVI